MLYGNIWFTIILQSVQKRSPEHDLLEETLAVSPKPYWLALAKLLLAAAAPTFNSHTPMRKHKVIICPKSTFHLFSKYIWEPFLNCYFPFKDFTWENDSNLFCMQWSTLPGKSFIYTVNVFPTIITGIPCVSPRTLQNWYNSDFIILYIL